MLQQPGALVFISSMMGDLAAFESPRFSLVKFERSSILIPCSSMFTIVYHHVLEDIEGLLLAEKSTPEVAFVIG